MLKSTGSLSTASILLDHNLLHTLCQFREDCYIVIAAFGATNVMSFYSITLYHQDATLLLSDGIPVQSYVDIQDYQYYKYVLSSQDLSEDFKLTLNAFHGDPNLFVACAPIYHPTEHNFTWSSQFWGKDTLIIPNWDYKSKCKIRPNGGLDFYIGVFGHWGFNITYTIMATASRDFDHRITLLDGQSQPGAFTIEGQIDYYAFNAAGSDHFLPTEISVVVTVSEL
jgi:hypothetical protein